MKYFGVTVLLVMINSLVPAVATAETANVTQIIRPTSSCSVDQTNNGQTQALIVQPEACQPYVNPGAPDTPVNSETTVQPLSTQATEAVRPSAATSTGAVRTVTLSQPGDQSIFENTIVEPLASWAGVGNTNGAMANPVTATMAVGTSTSLAVDAAFFQFAYTQRTAGVVKRRFNALLLGVRAAFRL